MTQATPPREPLRSSRRRQPSWAIHSADGVRIVGGTAPDWWDTSRPADPEPATPRTKPVAIFCADCRATSEPAL